MSSDTWSSSLLSGARARSRLRKELIRSSLGVSDIREAIGSNNAELEADSKLAAGHKGNNESCDEKRSEDVLASSRSLSSSSFLKGLSSLNPHNDYSQHFLDSGDRPQNFIRDSGLADRFEEYPKLKELIRLKNELVKATAHPPFFIKHDLLSSSIHKLLNSNSNTNNVMFDVVLVEPPLEEYARSYGVKKTLFWNWDKIMALDIPTITAPRSFVFLWCGSSEGLDLGRLCLQAWGFRRCEDICWIQTNRKRNKNDDENNKAAHLEPHQVFQRTKEHCLMGMRGTVRRSLDTDFIHANVDIDLIIDEAPPQGSSEKPEELFHIIEHFCLGKRRLHLFGRDTTVRPGWLTIGPDLTTSNYDETLYKSYFSDGQITTGSTDRIETLRPKSPPPKDRANLRNRPR